MSRHNRTLTPLLLLVASLLFAAQAGAVNLIQNGSFQLNNFTDWTIGTTSNGTWGSGYPVVSPFPPNPAMNSAQGEVGEVTFDQTQQGGTLTQTFVSAGGAATESLIYAATDPFGGNLDGGEFTMILNGVQIAQFDTGQIAQNQTITGTLSANASLMAGTNTLEIVVSRRFITLNQGTPFQFVTGVDVEGTVPEPSSIALLGVGALGLAGVLRRKLGF